jgi:hypothetical protein
MLLTAINATDRLETEGLHYILTYLDPPIFYVTPHVSRPHDYVNHIFKRL